MWAPDLNSLVYHGSPEAKDIIQQVRTQKFPSICLCCLQNLLFLLFFLLLSRLFFFFVLYYFCCHLPTGILAILLCLSLCVCVCLFRFLPFSLLRLLITLLFNFFCLHPHFHLLCSLNFTIRSLSLRKLKLLT